MAINLHYISELTLLSATCNYESTDFNLLQPWTKKNKIIGK